MRGRLTVVAKGKSRLFMRGSKGLPPVLLQAVVQKGAAVAVLGGQPGKGFQPKNREVPPLPRPKRLRQLLRRKGTAYAAAGLCEIAVEALR